MLAAAAISVFTVVRWGYLTTATVKSGYETMLWTRRVSKNMWKKSPFRRHKTETNLTKK